MSARAALDRLMPAVYDELRVIARRQLSGREGGGTLSTTGLVHEAYLKLVDPFAGRVARSRPFLRPRPVAMRHVLVDRARARLAQKREGALHRITLDNELIAAADQPERDARSSTTRSTGWRGRAAAGAGGGLPVLRRDERRGYCRRAGGDARGRCSGIGPRRACSSAGRFAHEPRSRSPRTRSQPAPAPDWPELAPLLDACSMRRRKRAAVLD